MSFEDLAKGPLGDLQKEAIGPEIMEAVQNFYDPAAMEVAGRSLQPLGESFLQYMGRRNPAQLQLMGGASGFAGFGVKEKLFSGANKLIDKVTGRNPGEWAAAKSVGQGLRRGLQGKSAFSSKIVREATPAVMGNSLVNLPQEVAHKVGTLAKKFGITDKGMDKLLQSVKIVDGKYVMDEGIGHFASLANAALKDIPVTEGGADAVRFAKNMGAPTKNTIKDLGRGIRLQAYRLGGMAGNVPIG